MLQLIQELERRKRYKQLLLQVTFTQSSNVENKIQI